MSPCLADSETRETPRTPWCTLTPGKLVGGLLVVELALLGIDRHSGWLCLAGVGAFILVVLMGLVWFGIAVFFQRKFPLRTVALLALVIVVAIAGGWLSWKWVQEKEPVDPYEGVFVVSPGDTPGDTVGGYYARIAAWVFVALAVLAWLLADVLLRNRFQFGIKTLLTLMVVVAVVGGWFGWKMERARRQNQTIERILSLQGSWREGDHWVRPPIAAEETWLEWLLGELRDEFSLDRLRDALGNDFFTDVENIVGLDLSSYCYSVLDPSERLKGRHYNSSRGLILVIVSALTDSDLEHIKRMTNLEELWLDCTDVTDTGLECVKGLPRLRVLNLCWTDVTDSGLEPLKGLPELQVVGLVRTNVTDEGVRNLQRALPNCTIYH
jgi:hypothetical protein